MDVVAVENEKLELANDEAEFVVAVEDKFGWVVDVFDSSALFGLSKASITVFALLNISLAT